MLNNLLDRQSEKDRRFAGPKQPHANLQFGLSNFGILNKIRLQSSEKVNSVLGLTERSTPAAPQLNSSFLEIDQFKETATVSVNLGQHFYQNCLKKNIFF